MIGKYRLIENDLFDISVRIKGIDQLYFVLYNYKLCRFEVHHSGQRGSTLALVLPFKSLDSRAVSLVARSRSERKTQILTEIEKENKRCEFMNRQKSIEKAAENYDKMFN